MEQQKNPGDTATATAPPTSTPDASGRMGRAKEFVSDKYSTASEAVKNKYTAVRRKVGDVDFDEMTGKVREYVRANPGKALLISVGIGFVIGLMLRRGRDDE